jgi:hypothetical protein
MTADRWIEFVRGLLVLVGFVIWTVWAVRAWRLALRDPDGPKVENRGSVWLWFSTVGALWMLLRLVSDAAAGAYLSEMYR